MEEFRVEEVLKDIRKKIEEKGSCTDELSYITSYHNRVVRKLKTYNELIIFGAGTYGEVVLEDLEQHGISTVKCFCDNNKKVIGQKIVNYSILSLDDAQKKYPEACFVITPKWYENEILSQLIHKGISIDNIILFNVELARLEV